jgi:ABC-type nitrate/sulfonate/bicarbonate transport system permease component
LKADRLRQRFGEVAPLAGLYAAWAAGSWYLGPGRLPGPLQTLSVLFESALHDPVILAQNGGSWGYLPHVLSTCLRAVAGSGIGIASGLALALAASQVRPILWVFDTAVELFRVVPPLILVPFAVLVCGPTEAVVTISVAIYSGLTMGMYALDALSRVPAEYVDLAKLLGANHLGILFSIRLPAILPELVGPLRVIASLGVGIAVVAEYLAAPKGIGRVMNFAMSYARADLILVGVIWTVLIVLCLDAGILLASRFLLRWTPGRNRRDGN